MSRTDLLRNRQVFEQREETGIFGGIFDFDEDDPDFVQAKNEGTITSRGSSGSLNRNRACGMSSMNVSGLRKVKTSPMTLSGMPYLADFNYGYSSGDELLESTESDADSTHHLTIENLRHHLNSCFSCGVSWQEDHVSLDCAECGGYSLTRPCPRCDGKCGQQWKRDLAASHSLGKANWSGICSSNQGSDRTGSS